MFLFRVGADMTGRHFDAPMAQGDGIFMKEPEGNTYLIICLDIPYGS